MLSSCARRALWPFWLGRTRAAAAAARAGHSPLIRVLILYVWLGVENQLESLSSPAVYLCCVLYSLRGAFAACGVCVGNNGRDARSGCLDWAGQGQQQQQQQPEQEAGQWSELSLHVGLDLENRSESFLAKLSAARRALPASPYCR